ncbi:thiolase family protein [Acidicapsa ligni]|uniref:thiolase family protein n=1 Tax=Acidicapsa ligni TaxID=542300 RepID=UPI0021E05B06|nr:thiolase family protein [Acidicapsa ligni]
MKPIYIAAYHQSRFGKLLSLTQAEMIRLAVTDTCAEIGITADQLDSGSIAAACNFSLHQQGLLAGLLAGVPGMAAKPLEAVENACASGGQAVLSCITKLQAGMGETAIAVGLEKMRDAEGRADGKRVGEALGYFSDPTEREGKTFVFPHIFAEIMQLYMKTWNVSEADLATIAVQEYANARHNPFAQMRSVELTVEQAMTIAGPNRYLVEGLPLKTYDCSQITDGYAAIIVATEEGLVRLGIDKHDCVQVAGWGQAVDPLQHQQRQVLEPIGAYKAMNSAYAMAGITPAEIQAAEIHDCFTVMGALGTEILGRARPGRGAAYWADGNAAPGSECGINTSGGLIAKGHPVGATGIAMIGWAAWQLLQKVPAPLQVKAAEHAATFNIGGPVCASVCTVLRGPQ